MAAPATPSNVYVQQANGLVYLSWDITAGATSYPILRSADGVTFVEIDAATINNFTDDTVVSGTQYYYEVSARNTDGDSPASASQSIVPVPTGKMSLGQVRLLAQQRADRVNSNFVTLPEWNQYIRQSYFELYDLLITTYEDYFLAEPWVLQTDGSANYELPDGSASFLDINGDPAKPFLKLMGVDLSLDANGNAQVTLGKFDFIERNRFVFPNVTSTFFGVFNCQYRVMGNKLRFIPVPSGGQVIKVWYIPRIEEPLKDTDIMDSFDGWLEYVICDAAIKALQKEESDVSVLIAEKQMLKQRIEESASNRDAGAPDTISSTRSWGSRNGGGWGPGFDGGFGGY